MALVAYRISKRQYAPFDGRGAARHGGRWNSPGREVIYCSRAYANALLEILVRANLGRIPASYHCAVIEVSEGTPAEIVTDADLPGWDGSDRRVSRRFGDRWLAELRTAVLMVPSLVARPFEQNVLVNPLHPAASGVSIGRPVPVSWDPRLFRHS